MLIFMTVYFVSLVGSLVAYRSYMGYVTLLAIVSAVIPILNIIAFLVYLHEATSHIRLWKKY